MSITRKATSWYKDGERISAEVVEKYILELEGRANSESDDDAFFEFLQPLIRFGRRLLVTLIVGVVAIMLLVYTINHWDGLRALFDGVAYFGGVVFGVLVIVLIIIFVIKALPMIWGWLKLRWSRIGSGSSTSKEV